MSRSGAWIALIKRPVNQSIEEHGGRARADHAYEHEEQKAGRWSSVGCNDERTERERECKNRMRKTNEAEKAADGTARSAVGSNMSILLVHLGRFKWYQAIAVSGSALPIKSEDRGRKGVAPPCS